MKSKCPYRTLKIKRDATSEEIQKAYRALAMKHHPDRNPGDEKAVVKFKEIQAAYQLLMDAERRAKYDTTGDASEAAIDNSAAEAAGLLVQVLGSVMNEILGAGQNPARHDIVKLMNKSLANGKKQMEARVRKANIAKADLISVAERFTVDGEVDGNNFLKQAVLSNLHAAEAEIATASKEARKIDLAIELLKKFKFTVEPSEPISGTPSKDPGLWFSVKTL